QSFATSRQFLTNKAVNGPCPRARTTQDCDSAHLSRTQVAGCALGTLSALIPQHVHHARLPTGPGYSRPGGAREVDDCPTLGDTHHEDAEGLYPDRADDRGCDHRDP